MRVRSLAVLLAVGLAAGCGKREDTEDVMMRAGLDALSTRHDPRAAAAKFREVLARSPAHYGATVQLAMALDAAGKPDEARLLWEKVVVMAEAQNDRQMLDTARARLGARDPMQAGLDALYKRNDPEAAVVEFRKVLQRDPGHYGATYQLAAALDAAGKKDQARVHWEKMLRMAEASGDKVTADTARARLATP